MNEEIKNEEIKSCPFCGWVEIEFDKCFDGEQEVILASCIECLVVVSFGPVTLKEGVAAWNKRLVLT